MMADPRPGYIRLPPVSFNTLNSAEKGIVLQHAQAIRDAISAIKLITDGKVSGAAVFADKAQWFVDKHVSKMTEFVE